MASGIADLNANSNTPEGLSTGAKAGIGVGGAIGAIAVAFIIYILLQRRRFRRNEVHRDDPHEVAPGELPTKHNYHEAPGDSQHRFEKYSKPVQPIQELSADPIPNELSRTTIP
jgi:hypothetical protein